MEHCKNCKIDVAGKRRRCPLCQGNLSGTPTEESFPVIPTIYHQFNFLFKILLFITIAGAVIAVAINLIFEETGLWSHFVVFGVICLWLSLSFAIRKRKNIPKGLLYQVILLSLLCIFWDFLTGWRGWSIDYAIPILCLSVMAAMAVLSKVLEWQIENIIIYFCIDALFGIIPLIFVLTRIVNVRIPSIICVAGSILSVAAIAVFKGDSIWAELKRRLYL